jgi:hypothetical protein
MIDKNPVNRMIFFPEPIDGVISLEKAPDIWLTADRQVIRQWHKMYNPDTGRNYFESWIIAQVGGTVWVGKKPWYATSIRGIPGFFQIHVYDRHAR